MSHAQPGFNAKARQSSAGSRKKGKLKRKRGEDKASVEGDEGDPNASIIVPKSKESKEAERREKLRQELAAQSDSKWNSKKKKRLDKYIDKKLKKEERVLIFERLAQTQAEIPSSIHLQSSSSLGTGKVSTHLERLEKLEDKEVRRALDGHTGKRKRRNDIYSVTGPDGDGDDDDDDDELVVDGRQERPSVEKEHYIRGESKGSAFPEVVSAPVPSAVGSALQRNPDGSTVAPKIRLKGKTKQSVFGSWKDKKKIAPSIHSDTSFDSSDSAYDSSESEDNSEDSDPELDIGADRGPPAAEETEIQAPRKHLGFKDWATKQISIAKGYDVSPPSTETLVSQVSSPPTKKRKIEEPIEMRGPLGEDLKIPATTFAQHLQSMGSSTSPTKVKAVIVNRPRDVEEARILLPIVTEEHPIMEAVLLNPVVIICGETGSGKTTQVPQFLYEAGFGTPGSENPGMIGITQPRRVAAMAMAARVSHELSLTSSRVSYQIRYDATVSPATSIKFMTDGVLLRELATDFLLTKYSVIIIDEAHERSMNTDILIGVLSRVLKLREIMWKEGKDGVKPLRLIIMSATLRVSDFAENQTLFTSPPPVINVAARQHPVTIHFNRRTSPDYVTEAIKKTTKIHTRLPPGGILVFLTGQNEITGVCRKLEAKFGRKALEERQKRRGILGHRTGKTQFGSNTDTPAVAPIQADVEAEDIDLGDIYPDDLAFDVDEDMNGQDADALDSDGEQDLNEELGLDPDETDVPMHIVPLYSLLPSDKQMRVFQPPPPGSRLVVVSTNVAETSLTIPNIRYVVDCGRAKERRYDVNNGIQAFQISWVSKASAAQRAGRAGRTGPGHCYRLYSSALFEHHFEKFSQPEIYRMPIEGVVLQMKSMHIDAVLNFPFPTPPERSTLRKAEATLIHLGALATSHLTVQGVAGMEPVGGKITELGKTMSLFPVSPRFSRMLVSGQQQGCLPYVISIVSALSVGDPFLHEEGVQPEEEGTAIAHLTNEAAKLKESQRLRRKAFFESQNQHASLGQFTSDILKVLSVVGAYEYARGGHDFCLKHFVRPKAMEEIHKLRAQISNIVQMNFPEINSGFVPNLRPPSALQLKTLRQLLTAGFIDQVAIRKDRISQTQSSGVQYTTAKGVAYRALGVSEDVFIHPSSVLANVSPPEFVVFHEIVRTSQVWLKGVTVINPAWLASLGKQSLCSFSKPVKNAAGIMMTIPRFGPEGWELSAIKAMDVK